MKNDTKPNELIDFLYGIEATRASGNVKCRALEKEVRIHFLKSL